MRSPASTGLEAEGGGWISQSSSDMTDSDEEEIPRFRPGEHDPIDFYEAVELKVSDKKDMTATRFLGVLARHMEEKSDARGLLKWKKLANMPNATVALNVATQEELMDAFVLSYPMEDVENQATEKLLEMTQKTRLKPYKTEVYDQLVKMEMITAANDVEAHKIKVKDNRFWIKVVMGGFQRTLDKRISKKFKNALSIHDFVLAKFLKDEFNSMKQMFDAAAAHEIFLIRLAGEAKTKGYWNKAASKRQPQHRRSAQAADSGDDAVCLVDAEQEATMTGFKEEVKEELQKVRTEIQSEVGERIKEARTEIEQDLITPLKNKMAVVDEKVDGMDKKMDTLTSGMKLLLERNETAPAPAPATDGRPPRLPAAQLPFYRLRQATNGFDKFNHRRPAGGRGGADMTCFKCGQKGHGFRNCSQLDVAACVEVGRAINEFDDNNQCAECSTEELCMNFDPDGKLDDGTGQVVCYLAQDWIKTTISKLQSVQGNEQALPSREQSLSSDKQVKKRHHKHEELTAVQTSMAQESESERLRERETHTQFRQSDSALHAVRSAQPCRTTTPLEIRAAKAMQPAEQSQVSQARPEAQQKAEEGVGVRGEQRDQAEGTAGEHNTGQSTSSLQPEHEPTCEP